AGGRSTNVGGSGGGGAGGVGAQGVRDFSGPTGFACFAAGGNGGGGLTSTITGSTTYYAGGGGGGANNNATATPTRGLGGGGDARYGAGDGANVDRGTGTAATANSGSGGGGGDFEGTGAAGGSGIVIVRWTPAILVLSLDAARAASYSGSGTTWTDTSGNSNNATLVGSPSLTTATSSRARGFTMNTPTDVNQWATLGSGGLSNFEGGITIQATVDFGSSADSYERIVDLGSAADTDAIIFGRELTDRTLYFEVVRGLNGGQGRCRATNAISDTAEMANFAVTLGGVGATPTCKIYKNGADLNAVWDASGARDFPTNVTRSSSFFGRSNWSADADFSGVLRSLKIYSYPLSEVQIGANYDAERQFTVSYNGNSPTSGSAPPNQTYEITNFQTAGTAVTLSGNTGSLTRTGYSFNGWCTVQPAAGATCDSVGGNAYAASDFYQTAADLTLYAVWSANTLTVTTDEQGGSAIADTSTTTGASMSSPGSPTRAGYSFAGWFVA
ncbi:MAG: InlB B-repeat-containing protein, partial [Ilumatobacteraceae bacterium]